MHIAKNDGLQLTPKTRKNSGRALPHLATRIFNTPLMIRPDRGDVILAVLGPRLGLSAEAIPVIAGPMPGDDEECSYSVQNQIAVIPVRGTLVKRSTGMDAMSGMTSYETLAEQITDAMTDPAVKGMILDCDSPGGESAGMFDLCDLLYSMRGTKPMSAVSNDGMYSAAYALGSCADMVYVSREGGVGSVGCYLLHVDQSGMDKARGLKFEYVYAGDHKVDGNPHEPLTKDVKSSLQAEVNRQRDMFVSLVSRNRNVSAAQVLDTQAGCFYGPGAVPLLADRVGGLDDAMEDMMARLGIEPEAAGPDDELALPGLALVSSRQELADYNVPPQNIVTSGRSIKGTAIPPHKTATSDGSWDGPANEARLKNDQTSSYYRKAYAWQETGSDGTKKNQFKFIHHEVSGSGDTGAANVTACRTGIAVLNGARGGTTIPASDRSGVYSHLAKHLRDAGVDPPDLKSEHLIALEEQLIRDRREVVTDIGSLVVAAGRRGFADREYSREASRMLFGNDSAMLAVRQLGVVASVGSQGSSRQIKCCVAPYNQLSMNLGGFRELYQPGCFKESLASGDDIWAYFDHDAKYVLGRRSAGTARFYEQADGLYFEADPPETTWAEDLLCSMRRGDINHGSAAFFILQPRWEYRSGEKVRVIEKAKLVEGSVLARGAYESSQANVQPALAAEAIWQQSLAEASLRILKLR